MTRYSSTRSGSRRLLCGVILLALSIFHGLRVAVAAELKLGESFSIPSMESVGDTSFDRDQFKKRWLLFFASSRDSADESKRWGKAVAGRYKTAIAGWDKDRGQRVLVVPVLDTSSGLLDDLPLWATKFMVKNLGGGDERAGVLIDRTGEIRSQVQPLSPSDAVIVLVSPDDKLEAYAVGDYSPESAAKLFAVIDSALAGAE